ncbi:di-trans,poly-cis-decaprenylcistransferase [Candidatus Woesebacteria bacterium]|nr:di-trans,poly-cis-decaprenylcistransferase [Candidatus Woesebacteria bacterium]
MTTHPLRHIAIIPDGNRRWAKARGKLAMEGHKYAVEETFPKLFDTVQELEIEFCTVWLLSPENFTKREQQEINNILMLLKLFLRRRIDELDKKKVKLQIIGDIDVLPEDTKKELASAVARTRANTKTVVTFAINYGGRDEIVRAIQRMNQEACDIERLSKEDVGEFLDTAGMPDPDLIIRTGGEKRTSGFLPWQSEYAEYAFVDTLFPDFTPDALKGCVDDFLSRNRRFGS